MNFETYHDKAFIVEFTPLVFINIRSYLFFTLILISYYNIITFWMYWKGFAGVETKSMVQTHVIINKNYLIVVKRGLEGKINASIKVRLI